jgi:hypothetical protein
MQWGPRSRSLPISVPRSAKSWDVPNLFGAASLAAILTMGVGFLASPDLAKDAIVSAAEVAHSLIQWMEYLAILLIFALVCASDAGLHERPRWPLRTDPSTSLPKFSRRGSKARFHPRNRTSARSSQRPLMPRRRASRGSEAFLAPVGQEVGHSH